MNDLRSLTQEERQAAYSAAQEAVVRSVGPRPGREQFAHSASAKYPPSVTRLITLLCIVLLLAAFTPSAIRLYVIGSDTFGEAINNTIAKNLVGLATVLSAETGQIVFSLALATLGTTRSSRRLLYLSALIATGVALCGNVQVALPGNVASPFAWLEAITPPLLVLSTAYVLKEQMLESIGQRHANERAYQDALATWLAATSAPESHARWQQFYANALRDSLIKANARRKDALSAVSLAEWRSLIYREKEADHWYQEQPAIARVDPIPLVLSSNGNGYHDN